MTELKNYLAEKNISVQDFAKITNIKLKRLNAILNNQGFFSESELNNVTAFLGVSKNEFYHGVFGRNGELPEVNEQNNLSHFRYYIKTRMKNPRRLFKFLDLIGGFSFLGICALYILLMFAGVTGLPTTLRSLEVLLPCFVVPVCGMLCFTAIARAKVLERNVTPNSKINVETVGVSFLLIVFAISVFANDFTPVTSLVLTIVGAIVFSAISLISPFKNKHFSNRILKFVVYMLPTVFLSIAEVFSYKYIVSITPTEEGVAGEALATAADMFNFVFILIMFVVFFFSLVRYYNVFIKGAGKFFVPFKKSASITRGKLATYIIGWIVVACITFLAIWVSQGIYLKYMYTNMFEGQEDTVNWTSELITNYDARFQKGEYDIIKFDGMKIKIPKAYKLDEETEYNAIYKNGEYDCIILRKPMYEQSLDYDLFDEDFADGKLTEKQLNDIKEDFVKYFGFYPTNFYEWQKLNGLVTLDDIDIFNPRKTAILSTVFIVKATTVVPNSEYYLYENENLYATIMIATIENEEKGNREMVSISFGSKDLEYGVTMARPDQDNDKTIEEVTKILNSINLK